MHAPKESSRKYELSTPQWPLAGTVVAILVVHPLTVALLGNEVSSDGLGRAISWAVPVLFAGVLLVCGGTIMVRRGGVLTIDRDRREIVWRHHGVSKVKGTWAFSNIAAVRCRRRVFSDRVKIDVGSRTFQLREPRGEGQRLVAELTGGSDDGSTGEQP